MSFLFEQVKLSKMNYESIFFALYQCRITYLALDQNLLLCQLNLLKKNYRIKLSYQFRNNTANLISYSDAYVLFFLNFNLKLNKFTSRFHSLLRRILEKKLF